MVLNITYLTYLELNNRQMGLLYIYATPNILIYVRMNIKQIYMFLALVNFP